jgi:hypothetical protein
VGCNGRRSLLPSRRCIAVKLDSEGADLRGRCAGHIVLGSLTFLTSVLDVTSLFDVDEVKRVE